MSSSPVPLETRRESISYDNRSTPGSIPRILTANVYVRLAIGSVTVPFMSSIQEINVVLKLLLLPNILYNVSTYISLAYIIIRFSFDPADGDRFNSCQVIYSQFGLAIHQNDHQARRRFVEWAQNEIAVVPDFHKRILFSDEAHFWLNGYVNKQNCRIYSEANPQVYVTTPLHPEKLTVWCALWAGGILLQKR
ncbi:hypothetical protein TNCV_331041 [Trichonephila clavipes]|nr:hypothetical protein TNCV_331041 [Trichonephila clavipes]